MNPRRLGREISFDFNLTKPSLINMQAWVKHSQGKKEDVNAREKQFTEIETLNNALFYHDKINYRNLAKHTSNISKIKDKKIIQPGLEALYALLRQANTSQNISERFELKKSKVADLADYEKWLEEQKHLSRLSRFKALQMEIRQREVRSNEAVLEKYSPVYRFFNDNNNNNINRENDYESIERKLEKTIREIEEIEAKRISAIKSDL